MYGTATTLYSQGERLKPHRYANLAKKCALVDNCTVKEAYRNLERKKRKRDLLRVVKKAEEQLNAEAFGGFQ